MPHQPDIQSKAQKEFVTLIAGGQSFCIEITQIREIRRWAPVTLLPHAAEHVLGVINLRGAVIPIVDLAVKLGFSKIEPTERNVIIIVAIKDKVVGLLVESVSEILGVATEEIRELPRGQEDATTHAIAGIIPIEDEMTKIISLSALLPELNQVAA